MKTWEMEFLKASRKHTDPFETITLGEFVYAMNLMHLTTKKFRDNNNDAKTGVVDQTKFKESELNKLQVNLEACKQMMTDIQTEGNVLNSDTKLWTASTIGKSSNVMNKCIEHVYKKARQAHFNWFMVHNADRLVKLMFERIVQYNDAQMHMFSNGPNDSITSLHNNMQKWHKYRESELFTKCIHITSIQNMIKQMDDLFWLHATCYQARSMVNVDCLCVPMYPIISVTDTLTKVVPSDPATWRFEDMQKPDTLWIWPAHMHNYDLRSGDALNGLDLGSTTGPTRGIAQDNFIGVPFNYIENSIANRR